MIDLFKGDERWRHCAPSIFLDLNVPPLVTQLRGHKAPVSGDDKTNMSLLVVIGDPLLSSFGGDGKKIDFSLVVENSLVLLSTDKRQDKFFSFSRDKR